MLEGDRASLWGRSRRGTAEISARSVRETPTSKSCSVKRSVKKKRGNSIPLLKSSIFYTEDLGSDLARGRSRIFSRMPR